MIGNGIFTLLILFQDLEMAKRSWKSTWAENSKNKDGWLELTGEVHLSRKSSMVLSVDQCWASDSFRFVQELLRQREFLRAIMFTMDWLISLRVSRSKFGC